MDLLDQLERDGFGIVRGLVSAVDLEAIREGFDHLMAQAPDSVDDTRFVRSWDPFRLHRVVWCDGLAPTLGDLGADPRFLGLATRVLGSPEVVQLIQQAHFKIPGDEVAFAWHQDASNRRYGSELWTDVDGRGSFVEIALAVDPMGPENGGLRMIPGSHRLGFVADPVTGEIPKAHLHVDRAVDLVMEPGDAAVFGPFVIHGSGPNRGTVPRRLFLQGYALPGANRRVYPGCGTGIHRR